MRHLILLLVIVLHGCASGGQHLDIAARQQSISKGPLSEVPQVKFDFRPLDDARAERDRIGYSINDAFLVDSSLHSKKPVTDVVLDAMRLGFLNNGHALGTPADVIITGSVTRFWYERKDNLFTIELTGNIECDMEFTSTKTSQSIYKSRYSGTYTKTMSGAFGVTDKTMAEIMDISVEKLVEDIVYDSNLIEALEAKR